MAHSREDRTENKRQGRSNVLRLLSVLLLELLLLATGANAGVSYAAKEEAAGKEEAVLPHTHGAACRERLHTHAVLFDRAEKTYLCTHTGIRACVWSQTRKGADSRCVHWEYHYLAEYACNACGTFLYAVSYDGCNSVLCENYNQKERLLAEGEKTRNSLPAEHTYSHAGERFLCKNTGAKKTGSQTDYELHCDQCDTVVRVYHEGETWSNFSGNFHYYYVLQPEEDSCYSFGEIHSGSTVTERTVYQEECWNHEDGAHRYTDVDQKISCTTCGLTFYTLQWYGCGSCGTRVNGDASFDICFPEAVGEPIYEYYGSSGYVTNVNSRLLHRKRVLTCQQFEYGTDRVCNQAVAALTAGNTQQRLSVGESVDGTVYVRYADGHREMRKAAVTGWDPSKGGEWQTVTLTYGDYLAEYDQYGRLSRIVRGVSSVTIRVFLEKKEFRLTLKAEAEEAVVRGDGVYAPGTQVTIGTSEPEGTTFLGWYDGTQRKSMALRCSIFMPAEDLTLTARFMPKNFRVTATSESMEKGLAAGGGSFAYRSPVTVKAVPKQGFSFLGWYRGETLVSRLSEYSFRVPAGDITLTARFQGTELMVSFDAAGGSACTAKAVRYLSSYGTLPTPDRSGFVFLGWRHGEEIVTTVSPVTITTDHTLTAVWAEAVPEFLLVFYGEPYGNNSYGGLPHPQKQGYTFRGWFLTENAQGNGDDLGEAGNRVTSDTMVRLASDHTIYARWQENTYLVVFQSNGGTECAGRYVTYDRNYGYEGELPVPQRAGYTFAGWYATNVGGNGDGVQITNGTRVQLLSKQTLYARWVRNGAADPGQGEQQETEQTVCRMIRREGADQVLLYADDYDPVTGAEEDYQPYLVSSVVVNGEMRAEGGIPSTEWVCLRAKTGAWMFSYTLRRRTGTEYVRYVVTVPYRTQYEGNDGITVVSEQRRKTYRFLVPKEWSYDTVEESGVFYPSELTVWNEAFQDGAVTLSVEKDPEMTEPEWEVLHYGEPEAHRSWAEGNAADGMPESTIWLPEQYLISETIGEEPEVENRLFLLAGDAAWADDTQFLVRSDRLTVVGITVLSDEVQADGAGCEVTEMEEGVWQERIPETEYARMYQSGLRLRIEAPNGSYESTAVLTYRGGENDAATGRTPTVELEANGLLVHTPVACDGILFIDGQSYGAYRKGSGNESRKQENEMDAVLMLRKERNPLRVAISNYGYVARKAGYGERDYAFAKSGVCQLAREGEREKNQVSFPFPVQEVVSEEAAAIVHPAGQWITVGREEREFFVPVTQPEGRYEVRFRSIAVNCQEEAEEENKEVLSSIAYDSVWLEIRGYVYELRLEGITEEAAEREWKQGRLPILKKGYSFSYSVKTNGSLLAQTGTAQKPYLRIPVSYEWVPEDKSDRIPVTLYYCESIGNVLRPYTRLGSVLDLSNIHTRKSDREDCSFSFGLGRLDLAERLGEAMQCWHGTLYLPEKLYLTRQDFDLEPYAAGHTLTGQEAFWLTGGYLVVHMQPEAVNAGGEHIALTDWGEDWARRFQEAGIPYREGDVLCYWVDHSANEDYEVSRVVP